MAKNAIRGLAVSVKPPSLLGFGLFQALQFFAGLKANGFAGRDADFFAGARVAADAGLARLYGEDAKAA